MKAVILSAGQGKRLLPHTADKPKCTVPVNGQSIVEWQIQALLRLGIDSIHIVVGFGAEKVEALLAKDIASGSVRTIYNPFFAMADNLMSCWVARNDMTQDFVLINGDTMFELAVLEGLLQAPSAPITLVTDEKAHYDADDMKVIVRGTQLHRIGKTLPIEQVNGESIGMIRFQGQGPKIFLSTLDQRIRKPEALKQWYLSLIDELAQQGHVSTFCIKGLIWAEIDNPSDLEQAERLFKNHQS
ncbi:MAG: phosphocholine cytidylyltransferase family protein [Nitrospirota bacterium]|nr:phosphocholine cytidylyltransferase family protein [Nitrospirota bacterium]MDH5699847.1 phosphocholine cytidylyltransferase family protein [Nitrospirota bacterium]